MDYGFPKPQLAAQLNIKESMFFKELYSTKTKGAGTYVSKQWSFKFSVAQMKVFFFFLFMPGYYLKT